ncbi:MAG: glycosyltransferase family 39 protein [Acidobacteriaceae bacterium]
MQLIQRLRLPAVFCALAVLLCELVSRPFSTMGFVDDWPYILSAQKLANTGHIVYNGWAAPILGWHLYLGAAFIKLFGFSLTTVRMSSLVVALLLAFFLQRIMVLCGTTERNATIGTLAFVLSPLYLMLSVTFMTDITGLFSVVLCFYGCLRALTSISSRAAIGWLCFAVATNAVLGTSRQIEWLGIFVMVPSALWLFRTQRRVLLAGSVATLLGALFIFVCMQWFARQPYTIPEHLIPDAFPIAKIFWQYVHCILELPFLLLPIFAIFLASLRKSRPRVVAVIVFLICSYIFLAFYPSHLRGQFPLEPTMNDWIEPHGIFETVFMKGVPPLYFPRSVGVLFTVLSLGGSLGLIALLGRMRPANSVTEAPTGLSWYQLLVLTVPFAVANLLIFLPRAATYGITVRYLLGILVVALPCLVRCYQEYLHPRLPIASMVLVAFMALFSIALIHNLFSFYRARVALVAELQAAGVPPTSVDNGWEYNVWVELQHAPYINNVRMVLPPHAYVPTHPQPADNCKMSDFDAFPHIHPVYGVSFSPDACYGLAPFAPVHYSRWPHRSPGTLYVVRYVPPSKPEPAPRVPQGSLIPATHSVP